VREFCALAFAEAGLPLTWSGKEIDEKGYGPDGRILVEIDPRYFRPTEVDFLLGDYSKAKVNLGWEPSVSFSELVRIMVQSDDALAAEEARRTTNSEQAL
jgi:GDPmannose 4,6-dehydratase